MVFSKKENQKASKVVDAVELSTAQVEYIDNAIGYQLNINDMDTIYNKDRASLKKLLIENVALAMGNENKTNIAVLQQCIKGIDLNLIKMDLKLDNVLSKLK